MENLIFSANVVVPLMLIMAAGYLARSLKLLDAKTTSICNNLVFKMFLPILLFNNTRNCDVSNISDLGIFIFVAVAVTLVFALVTVFTIAVEKDNAKRGVMIQGICRSNYALFGIPLVTLLMPNEDISLAAVLVALVIPIFNVYSVSVLTYFGTKNADFKKIFTEILKNPLIIGTFIGLIFMFLNIELIPMLDTTFNSLGGIASSFALFLLGAGFEFKQVANVKKQLAMVCLGRLIVVPLIVLSIAILIGYREVELACLIAVFCSPTAASSFTMAEKMGGNPELASSVVVFTSMFSIFSVFFAIFIFRALGFI